MFRATGIIKFDPENKTKKHEKQSSWKSVVMIQLDCETDRYYSWFVQRRYNLKLNKPIRGSHVTIVSDIVEDKDLFERIKNEYDGKPMEFVYDPDARTNGEHWWLKVTCEEGKNFREKLRLPRDPYWGFHLTLGYANEKMIDHSFYIWDLIKKGLITH
jgi:hypothetical protein